MSIIKNKVFTDLSLVPKADEYHHCNFGQLQPLDDNGVKVAHRLFPGDDTPRTFYRCNLSNVEPPPGSTCIMSNTWIVENSIDGPGASTIVIDGVEVHRKQHKRSVVHGRWHPDSKQTERLGTPIIKDFNE